LPAPSARGIRYLGVCYKGWGLESALSRQTVLKASRAIRQQAVEIVRISGAGGADGEPRS